MAAARRMPGVNLQTSFQVISMHAFSPAVSKLLFHAASRKLQPRLVKERAKLVHASHPDENGRSIRDDLETRLAFARARSLQLRAPRSPSPETTAESPERLEISESKARFVQAFRRRWPVAVGCTPNRQETDNRDGRACSQRAEWSRCPDQEWQREKKKSPIGSRS